MNGLYACSYGLYSILHLHALFLFPGFSFGGLLACAVAALVWSSPYISSDLLKENLACITFGQPHVRVPFLPDVARQRPDLLSTIHCIYHHDDAVPYLMSFLDESSSYEAQLKAQGSKPISHYPIPEELRAVSVVSYRCLIIWTCMIYVYIQPDSLSMILPLRFCLIT